MTAITTEMIEASYSLAKEVYEGRRDLNNAVSVLKAKYGMNHSSAHDYIYNFKHMLNGEEYKRTNSLKATRIYFDNILKDYGRKGLKRALDAQKKHIDYYGSLTGTKVPGQKKIYKEYSKKVEIIRDTLFPDEILGAKKFFEGATRKVYVNSYERNSKARKSCLKYYGYLCAVCKFDFSLVYGEIGLGFIHVHHLIELSTIKKKYKIDPIKDLRPVCPNCHAMLHKNNPPYTIKQLRKIIADNK